MMPQDIPTTFNGCGKKFSIKHALSCPKVGLVLAQHNDTAKEWGTLGSWSLVSSAISYKPKIKSGTVQGDRTGSGACQDSRIVEVGAVVIGESQESGGSGRIVNRAAVVARTPGHIEVPADSRSDVSVHIFWKWGGHRNV